jgi:hypothetical protein
MDRGKAHVTEAQKRDVEDESTGSGESLKVHKALLKPEKGVDSSVQRCRLFRTTCKNEAGNARS